MMEIECYEEFVTDAQNWFIDETCRQRQKHYGGSFCCIPGCANQSGRDKANGVQRSYYRLPKDMKERAQWLKLIRRSNWSPRDWDRVCSDHFVEGL